MSEDGVTGPAQYFRLELDQTPQAIDTSSKLLSTCGI